MNLKCVKGFVFILVSFCGCNITCDIDQPNVLVILVDDLGWADLGYSGSTYYETPNIDKLAAEGMQFTSAYAASPVCSPSRAAIMSGKYPARLNVTDYIPGNRHWGPHKDQLLTSDSFKLQLESEEYTLAEAFKTVGYKTMFAGKWHLGEDEKFYPQYQGFDVNFAGNGTGHPRGGYFTPYNNPELPDGPEGEYLTDRLSTEVIEFIESEKEQPFFVYLSYYTVHLPMEGKKEKVEKYTRKLPNSTNNQTEFKHSEKTFYKTQQNIPSYAAMVESMDENVGRVLRCLKDQNLDENTIVVFTSDNGGMSTSRRVDHIPTSNLPLRAGKGYLYEGGIRVPLIVKHSKKYQGNSSALPVNGTDLFPTLLELAGLPSRPGQHLDGRSLVPLLNDEGMEERPIFWHYPHYSGGLGGRPSGAVRLGPYKLIEFYEDMHVELFNLETDIEEKYNLAQELPEKLKELKTWLHNWRVEIGAQMPFPNPEYEDLNTLD